MCARVCVNLSEILCDFIHCVQILEWNKVRQKHSEKETKRTLTYFPRCFIIFAFFFGWGREEIFADFVIDGGREKKLLLPLGTVCTRGFLSLLPSYFIWYRLFFVIEQIPLCLRYNSSIFNDCCFPEEEEMPTMSGIRPSPGMPPSTTTTQPLPPTILHCKGKRGKMTCTSCCRRMIKARKQG